MKRFSLSAKIIIVCESARFQGVLRWRNNQRADCFASQVFYIVSQLVATSTCGIVSRWPTCQVGLTMNNIDTLPHHVSNVFLFSMPKRAWNQGPDQIMPCYYIWDFFNEPKPLPFAKKERIIFSFCRKLIKIAPLKFYIASNLTAWMEYF